MVACPPRLMAVAGVGAAVGAAGATTGSGVACCGTMGATVAGGALLDVAGAVGRHAISRPTPPIPPRPSSRRALRRERISTSVRTPFLPLLTLSTRQTWIERPT